MDDRLYRSSSDRMIAGVAGGLAERMAVDPSLVRVVWLLLAIFSGGIFALIYVVMAVVVPERPIGMAPAQAASGPPPPEGQAPGSWTGPDGQPVASAAEGPATSGGTYDVPHRRRHPGAGAIVLGGILITVGVWTLIDRYVPGLDTATLWPVAVIVVGVVLVGLAFLRPSRT